jgi:hypothetical protein
MVLLGVGRNARRVLPGVSQNTKSPKSLTMPEQWPCLVQPTLRPSFVMSANPSCFCSNAVVFSPGLSVRVSWLRRLLLSLPDRPMLWAVVEALSVFLPVRPELWPLPSYIRTHRRGLSEAARGSGVCKINARHIREPFSKGRRPPAPPDFNATTQQWNRGDGGVAPSEEANLRSADRQTCSRQATKRWAFILQTQEENFRQVS